jgi:competence protein ComEC
MSRPLVSAACAFAAGAAVGESLPGGAALLLLGLAAVLLAASASPPRRRAPAVGASRWLRGSVLASAFAIAAASAAVEGLHYEAAPLRVWTNGHSDAGPVRLTGVCHSDPREAEGRWTLVLDVEELSGQPMAGRARIDVGGTAGRPQLMDGDRVVLWAELRAPRGLHDPGAFDAAAQARRDGIHAIGWCKSPRLVEPTGERDAGWLRDLAARARRWSRGRLVAALPPGREQALVRAMVLGERTALDAETSETFRMAGTYHVLALSGAQVAMVAALLGWVLRAWGTAPLVRALVLSSALAFYCTFVGGDVPVLRATVMAAVVLGGRTLDLDGDAANLLGLAALLLLAQRPSSIADIGFQLSFAATLGLVLLAPPVMRLMPALPFGTEVALASSLGAQAALGPLLAYHFHRLAPAALLLNLVAVPLSGVVLLAGFAILAASVISPALVTAAAAVAWASARGLLLSGEVVRLAPWLDVRVATPALGPVLVAVAGLAAFARGRGRGLVLWAAGTACIVAGWGPRTEDGRLHVTFLDVGQGDAIVIASPHGRTWMVDTGGSFDTRFDVGEAVLGPFLWRSGVPVLRGVVLTHAHPDHVGGVPFLLRAFDVRDVWEGIAPRRDRVYDELASALTKAGVARRAVSRGVEAEWDGVRVSVLGPVPPARAPWRTRNDDSVVLAIRYGEIVLLLTGDVEAARETALDVPHAFALKVAHHGSRSSSTPGFLAQATPRVAVVSVADHSPFGHPHPEVVARYQRAGIRLFRTDRDGAVTFSTDGIRVWMATYADGWTARIR